MSFLARLFGPRESPRGSNDLEERLRKLEAEAKNARPGFEGAPWNRAGDVALRAGEPDLAVGYYGRAVDAYLEDGQREAARGVANKIIRVRPAAVRTLCTLTWLDLAARHQATALLHLRDYAAAADEANQRVRAATQIFQMARISDSPEFLAAAADAMDGLNFSNRATQIRAWLAEGAPDAVTDDDQLAEVCLGHAARSNGRDLDLLSDVLPPVGAGAAEDEAGD